MAGSHHNGSSPVISVRQTVLSINTLLSLAGSKACAFSKQMSGAKKEFYDRLSADIEHLQRGIIGGGLQLAILISQTKKNDTLGYRFSL